MTGARRRRQRKHGSGRNHSLRLEIASSTSRGWWDPGDVPQLKAAIDASLDHLRPWMPWAHQEPEPLPTKVERLRRCRGEFDLDIRYPYGVFALGEAGVVGAATLDPRSGPGSLEIGYWVRADQVRKGFGTEVAAALTRVAFEVNEVERVMIRCHPRNEPSAAIARRPGFVFEGILRKCVPAADGSYEDTMVWTLLRSEYDASPARTYEVRAYGAAGERLL